MNKEWLIKEIFWIIDNPEVFDKKQTKERIQKLIDNELDAITETQISILDLEEEIRTLQDQLETCDYENENMVIEIAN